MYDDIQKMNPCQFSGKVCRTCKNETKISKRIYIRTGSKIAQKMVDEGWSETLG